MATSIQVKRGTTAKVAAYTPLVGELVLDTTTNKLYAGDGSTAGGKQVVASKKGVTDASTTTAGDVGEVITNTTTGTAITNGTAVNATSITLTPGDWDIHGMVRFDTTDAQFTSLVAAVNTTSATQPTFPQSTQIAASTTAGVTQQIPAPYTRLNVSVNTTVYAVAVASFASGTVTVRGFLSARRAR